jgi:polysaccharide pyruvyl transferase WcaK-like protein
MSFRQVSIVGAALSANKGAAAMVETVVARLPEYVGPVQFSLLTTYPSQDRDRLPADAEIRVVGLEPLRLALVEFPVALMAFVARKCHLPLGWVRTRANRAVLDSVVVVDIAGISFVDGRGLPITVYNALMTGLPLLLGVPTVKAAQALGPFESFPNKWLARLVLPRLFAICARGEMTRRHLDSLHLTNVHSVADLVFSLDDAVALPKDISEIVAAAGEGFIVVMPSAVVRTLYEANGGDYPNAMADVIRGIRDSTGCGVVIAAHSYRAGRPQGRMNDGPVCREIAALLSSDSQVVTLDVDLTARELRYLIAQGELLVASRFHAMISGLSTGTPTIVIGWSHKYLEVLDDFGLAEFGMDASKLGMPTDVVEKIKDAFDNLNDIQNQINSALSSVIKKSSLNFSVIAKAIES